MDRISNLPDNVTELIFDRLPVIDKVRTSVLSQNWRFRWTDLSSLVLDNEFLESIKCEIGSEIVSEYPFNIINSILLQHSGRIHNFSLAIPKDCPPDKFIHSVRYVSRLCTLERLCILRHLSSNNAFDDPFPLPESFFSSSCCSNLTHLELLNCRFCPPISTSLSSSSSFAGFPNLVSFELKFCKCTADIISCFVSVSNCPKLQELSVYPVHFDKDAHINAPNLKRCTILGMFKDICLTSARNLEYVYLSLFDIPIPTPTPISIPLPIPIIRQDIFMFLYCCVQLKEIRLEGVMCKVLSCCGALQRLPIFSGVKFLRFDGVYLSDADYLECVLRFCSCCVNVEQLQISVLDKGQDADISKISSIMQQYFRGKFGNLKKVEMVGFSFRMTSSSTSTITIVEMKMMELLLGISPILEEIRIHLSLDKEFDRRILLQRMLSLDRASQKAIFDFRFYDSKLIKCFELE